MVHREVVRELVVREPDMTNDTPALVADLGIRGMWQPQTMAL